MKNGLSVWGEEEPNALPPLLKIIAAVRFISLEALVLELDEGLLLFSKRWDTSCLPLVCITAFEGVGGR